MPIGNQHDFSPAAGIVSHQEHNVPQRNVLIVVAKRPVGEQFYLQRTPHVGSCNGRLRQPQINAMECKSRRDHKEEQQNESLRCADSGVLATTPNVMASLQAHHALLYLGLNLRPLKQKLLLWNGLNMTQRILNFMHDENCASCQAR